MPRKNLLVIVGVVVILAALWFVKSAYDNAVSPTDPMAANHRVDQPMAEPALERLPPKTATSAGSAEASTATSRSMPTNLESLQAQLAQEQSQLEAQKEVLANLQNQQAQVPSSTQYSSQMTQHQDQIQQLSDELRDTQNQEDRVLEVAQTSLQAQQMKTEQSRTQLDESIRAQQAAMVQTQNLIATWPNPNAGGTDVQARLTELQTTLANQQKNLADLQNQRNDLNTAVFQQADAVSAWSGQSHAELSGAQDAIQTQIYSLRDEIRRMQSAQGQSRMSVRSLSSQVSQVQKDINAQNLRVQSLQNEIQQQQSSAHR
jgi:chromosome segregation ATPase